MPIYGYRCDECGHEFEVFQNMSDAPLTRCPNCEGKLRKMLYPVGVVFKGSGFYSTDYRSSNGSKSESSEGSSGDSKSGSKTESKGEKKTESKAKSEGGGSSTSSSD